MFMPLDASFTACARPCPRAIPVMSATLFSVTMAVFSVTMAVHLRSAGTASAPPPRPVVRLTF
jgi:hypothetical protein